MKSFYKIYTLTTYPLTLESTVLKNSRSVTFDPDSSIGINLGSKSSSSSTTYFAYKTIVLYSSTMTTMSRLLSRSQVYGSISYSDKYELLSYAFSVLDYTIEYQNPFHIEYSGGADMTQTAYHKVYITRSYSNTCMTTITISYSGSLSKNGTKHNYIVSDYRPQLSNYNFYPHSVKFAITVSEYNNGNLVYGASGIDNCKLTFAGSFTSL